MIRNVSLNFKKILFIYLQKKKSKKSKKSKEKKNKHIQSKKKKITKKKKKKKEIKLLQKKENIIINYINFKFKDEFFNLKKLYLLLLLSSLS